VGISLAPEHGDDASSLLKKADVAMYAAKSSGRGYEVYDPATDHHTTRRLILATELKNALDVRGLEVHYQPKVEMRSGRVVGFEALLRWVHPDYGAVAPIEFIPAAEQTGLIGPLTQWVLDEALGQLRQWDLAGHFMDVSVNLSARSLLDHEIVDVIRDALELSGVSPERLILELTESSIMADVERSERVLASITELGVRIAMDDFGTGYSSLSRLTRLPVSEIKIDKSFVGSMLTSPATDAIVRTTVEMARSLGHPVCAEGVEDQQTWDRLVRLGCRYAQGWLLAKAMPGPECELWLGEHQLPKIVALASRRISASPA
jgi:EAL domain-containing protein (putative c-di-GMP-specific phosphodiesterase class I)